VVARSTVFRYKGKKSDPLAVGRELGIRGIVTGQIVQRGDRLIAHVELTDVKRGTHVWGDQYEYKVADVLLLQQELAQRISTELRTKLTGDATQILAHRGAVNGEAYQRYLKGRYHLNKNSEESIR